MIPQLPYPDGLIPSIILVYVLCCALPSWVIHEYLGMRAPWDKR